VSKNMPSKIPTWKEVTACHLLSGWILLGIFFTLECWLALQWTMWHYNTFQNCSCAYLKSYISALQLAKLLNSVNMTDWFSRSWGDCLICHGCPWMQYTCAFDSAYSKKSLINVPNSGALQ
jgi:hypothetical protein